MLLPPDPTISLGLMCNMFLHPGALTASPSCPRDSAGVTHRGEKPAWSHLQSLQDNGEPFIPSTWLLGFQSLEEAMCGEQGSPGFTHGVSAP